MAMQLIPLSSERASIATRSSFSFRKQSLKRVGVSDSSTVLFKTNDDVWIATKWNISKPGVTFKQLLRELLLLGPRKKSRGRMMLS